MSVLGLKSGYTVKYDLRPPSSRPNTDTVYPKLIPISKNVTYLSLALSPSLRLI